MEFLIEMSAAECNIKEQIVWIHNFRISLAGICICRIYATEVVSLPLSSSPLFRPLARKEHFKCVLRGRSVFVSPLGIGDDGVCVNWQLIT